VNPLEEILREEISAAGPIPFRRFMELSLYHPRHGYYTAGRDPFGVRGDFYTAEQLQPVFGVLAAAWVRELRSRLGDPESFRVVELGAGRREMAPAFAGFSYLPVEVGEGKLPPQGFNGVVFANEFFDALPVDVAQFAAGEYWQRLVDWNNGRFRWVQGPPVDGEQAAYLELAGAPREEGFVVEIGLGAMDWMRRAGDALKRGFALIIDYGYTAREWARFPQGTLMAYRGHAALDDVLAEPGGRDLTAHVCFTALERCAQRAGLERARFESLAAALLRAGESDSFAAALAGDSEQERLRRRMQLKTLLYGMGETFRVLLLEKNSPKRK